MAKVIDKVPEMNMYPWDEWLDGKARQLTEGDDYQTSTKSVACQAHSAARRRNIHARVKMDAKKQCIYIQAFPKQPAHPKKIRSARKAKATTSLPEKVRKPAKTKTSSSKTPKVKKSKAKKVKTKA